ncbi:ParB/RepB/Spo0J family partition protein [Pyxidicoccus sp. 3LFB2]
MHIQEKPSRVLKKPRRVTRVSEEDLRDLEESIRRHGLVQPIVTRPDGEVIIGQRRAASAKELGVDVPVIIRDDLDDISAAELRLSEELTHKPWDRLALAEEIRKLLELHKSKDSRFTPARLAERIGISRGRLDEYLSLSAQPQEIKREIREGRLSARDARVIADLAVLRPEEKVRLAQKVGAGKIPPGRKLEDEVAPFIRRAPEEARRQLIDNPIVDFWQAERHVTYKQKRANGSSDATHTVKGFVSGLVERLKFWRLAFHSARRVVPYIPDAQWPMFNRVVSEMIEELQDALAERTDSAVASASRNMANKPEKVIDMVRTAEGTFEPT